MNIHIQEREENRFNDDIRTVELERKGHENVATLNEWIGANCIYWVVVKSARHLRVQAMAL
jgi:hypothetical protein